MSNRLTDEELLAKMKAHIKDRKAVYDALVDGYREAAADPEYVKEQTEWVGGTESLQTAECGLFALYIPGHCVLSKGHEPAADHKTQYGEHFTRGLREDEGGHE